MYKKLSYRRGTARRTMLVNSCYVSRRMAVRRYQTAKVFFKVIQGHWQWCRHSTGHIRFLLVLHCNYMSLSCTVTEILSPISQNLKRSR